MKKLRVRVLLMTIAMAAMSVAVPANADAQVPAQPAVRTGYAFIVPPALNLNTGARRAWHGGGGGNAMIGESGFSLGGEYGYASKLACGACRFSGMNLLSLNAAFAPPTARKVRPFVSYGYTAGIARGGFVNLVNFGAGVDAWLSPRAGIRAELRGLMPVFYPAPVFGLRIGVVFR